MEKEREWIEKCRAYMERNGLSQKDMGKLVGYVDTTLSRWLSGSYPNPEAITEKVKNYLEKAEARAETTMAAEIAYAPTGISQTIVGVLEYCRLQRIIGIVYGDAGVGKTFTARAWAQDKPDVVLITGDPVFCNPKPFLKLLAHSLKLERQGSMDEILLNIYARLEGKDLTLIFDEAQHFSRPALEIIRGINDRTRTGIVLMGNEIIHTKMMGKHQAEFAQLFSRIAIKSNSLLTDMFSAVDVRLVFNLMENADTERDFAVDYLLKICRSKYGLRGAIHVYTNARNNGDISQKGLKAMAAMMGISV